VQLVRIQPLRTAAELVPLHEVPPLKWSILRYGFSKEDHDGKKEAYG